MDVQAVHAVLMTDEECLCSFGAVSRCCFS